MDDLPGPRLLAPCVQHRHLSQVAHLAQKADTSLLPKSLSALLPPPLTLESSVPKGMPHCLSRCRSSSSLYEPISSSLQVPSWSSLTRALPWPARDDPAEGRALPPGNRGHGESVCEGENQGTRPKSSKQCKQALPRALPYVLREVDSRQVL